MKKIMLCCLLLLGLGGCTNQQFESQQHIIKEPTTNKPNIIEKSSPVKLKNSDLKEKIFEIGAEDDFIFDKNYVGHYEINGSDCYSTTLAFNNNYTFYYTTNCDGYYSTYSGTYKINKDSIHLYIKPYFIDYDIDTGGINSISTPTYYPHCRVFLTKNFMSDKILLIDMDKKQRKIGIVTNSLTYQRFIEWLQENNILKYIQKQNNSKN